MPESEDRHFGLWADSGAAQDKFEKKNVSDVSSSGSSASDPRLTADARVLAAAKALASEPTPIAAAHHCRKINRVGSNRRELAQR